MKENIFERIIAFFSPSIAANRAKSRTALGLLNSGSRRYEAATKGRRTQGWVAPSSSSNVELNGALDTLRARSRDLARNNPYMSRALQVITGATVGDGISHKFTAKSEPQQKKIEDLWRAWGESKACDFYGLGNIYTLQAQVIKSVAEGGDCFARRIKTKSNDGLSVPLQIQLLEGDFVDNAYTTDLGGGKSVIQGVEFDSKGKRVAYHIWNKHPGDVGSKERIRVDAADIIPIFRVDRIGQVRGAPWGAPVMMKLNEFGEYEDAQLVRQKMSACHVGFIYDINGIADSQSAPPVDKFEPGMLEVLPPGMDIKFNSPPGVDGMKDYSNQVLHAIASGLGISYEALTGDFSQVNFSSARMAAIEMYRNVDQWRWNMLIPQFCEVVGSWFLEAAALTGVKTEGVTQSFTAPKREMIDPGGETLAIQRQIRSGLKTQSEALRELGYDPKIVLSEMKSDNDLIDQLGLALDTDPRKMSQIGFAQQPATIDKLME